MVKGLNAKQSGFSMYMEKVIRPKLEWKLGKRLGMQELYELGEDYWNELNYEEKREWKARAKAFNNSEIGRLEKMMKRMDYRQRNYGELKNSSKSQKLRPSGMIPPSYRYDEVDRYSRKYFTGVNDDYERMRNCILMELIHHYQWKFAQKMRGSKAKYFLEKEIMVVTANVYYEDSNAERVVPSEISILKISIERGFCDQRHYILSFQGNEITDEDCKLNAIENERLTGLLMDADKTSTSYLRSDYAQIWDEIKAFTKIDGDGATLFLLSDEWNIVVGSFDVLFVHAREKSFSRIETRFAVLEDYFMAMYAVVDGVRIADDIKLSVATQMRERWSGAVFYDLVTCVFHDKLKYTEQCQARNCSLFTAHEAVFNFFTLCKRYVFPTFEFTGRHMPDKDVLPKIEGDDSKCRPQRMHFSSSRQLSGSTKIVPKQVVEPVFFEKQPVGPISTNPSAFLNSAVKSKHPVAEDAMMKRGVRSTYNTARSKENKLADVTEQHEIRYGAQKQLQDRRGSFDLEYDLHNSRVAVNSTNVKYSAAQDPFTDYQNKSHPSTFTANSVSSFEICQDNPSYPFQRPKSCVVESHFTKNKPSSSSTRLCATVLENESHKWEFNSELNQTCATLKTINLESDFDLFSNISLPTTGNGQLSLATALSLQKQVPLRRMTDQNDDQWGKKTDVRQLTASTSIQTEASQHKSSLDLCRSESIVNCCSSPSPSIPSDEPSPSVRQSQPIPSVTAESSGCELKFSKKPLNPTSFFNNLIPEPIVGDNVQRRKDHLAVRPNSEKELGSKRSILLFQQNEMIGSKMTNVKISNGLSLKRCLSKLKQVDFSGNEAADVGIVLKPLTYIEAKTLDWFAGTENSAGHERTFSDW